MPPLDDLEEALDADDREYEFQQAVLKWLERASIAFLVLGGASSIALACWNPANVAAWIVLIGTLAVLIYLGEQAAARDYQGTSVAKRIGFFAVKLLAIVPITLMILGLVQPAGFNLPAHKHEAIFWISNAMFFGGMAAALLIKGGISPTEYFEETPTGWNPHHRTLFGIALIVCFAGFVFKYLNER